MFKINKQPIAAAVLAACLSAGVQVALAQGHGHSHNEGAPAQLTLNDGKKWATDSHLRQGMTNIRTAMATELPAIHSGETTAQQYQALAQKVNDQISFILRNCKLERDADAMLHLVLAELIAGADAMTGKNGPDDRRHGAEKIVHALESYATYFDQPDWRGVK